MIHPVVSHRVHHEVPHGLFHRGASVGCLMVAHGVLHGVSN